MIQDENMKNPVDKKSKNFQILNNYENENILVNDNDESSNSESENTLEEIENPEEAIMETIENIDKYNNNDQIIYDETISEYGTQFSLSQATNYQHEGGLENWFLFEKFDGIPF